jgi:aminoglycoside phosphotransferase (APT) family kinase protein
VDVGAAIEHAVAQLEPGGELVGLRELTGGVSADVFGLEIATSAGGTRRVVYRRHRADSFKQRVQSVTAKEHGLLAALHGAGLAVPEPYLYDDSDAVIGPYMVIEWIDGSTIVEAHDVSRALDQMAQFLVGLHSLDLPSLQLPQLESIEDPLTAIVAYLPPTASGERVRAAIDSGSLERAPARSVLLHGDYWPGNVLWRERGLVAVIDWEDACLGDPLADVATARVELLCQYGTEAMEQFTSRYLALAHDAAGPLRLDSLLLWELYVSAAALATMSEWALEPSEEARRRRLTEGFFDRAARELGEPHPRLPHWRVRG